MSKELQYYGGSGHESYPYRFGKFQIKYGNDEVLTFISLDKAVEVFDRINDDKALWDSLRSELIDAYLWVEIQEKDSNTIEDDLPF